MDRVLCAASSTADSSDEESVESVSSDEENVDDDDNFNLWENFFEDTIEMKKWSILDTLCYFLSPYILRLEDDTYKEIMHDVEEALHYHDMSYLDALDNAVVKNKDLILISIDNVLEDDCDDDDPLTIWRALAAAVKTKNKECRSSSSFYYECCGIWMITHLKYMLRMFHYMDMDDVIQDIVLSIETIMYDDDENEVSLWDASHIAVGKHGNAISEKAREAEKRISERIIPSVSSGAGMYLNPWRYK